MSVPGCMLPPMHARFVCAESRSSTPQKDTGLHLASAAVMEEARSHGAAIESRRDTTPWSLKRRPFQRADIFAAADRATSRGARFSRPKHRCPFASRWVLPIAIRYRSRSVKFRYSTRAITLGRPLTRHCIDRCVQMNALPGNNRAILRAKHAFGDKRGFQKNCEENI